jgi:hypothetical protein
MQLDGARVSPALLSQLSEGYTYSTISGHGLTAGRRPLLVPAQAASSVDAVDVESAESEPKHFCLRKIYLASNGWGRQWCGWLYQQCMNACDSEHVSGAACCTPACRPG